MDNRIEISVITVNYNGLNDTCELIDTIPSDPRVEVVVVDNGSKTDEAAEIKRRYPHVKVVRSDRNLGFAGGNNLGIRQAVGQYLYFVNNDTLLSIQDGRPGFDTVFQPLVNRLRSDMHIGMVCPKIRFAWAPQPIQFAGFTPLSAVTLRNRAIGYNEEDRGQHNTPCPTPYAHGAAMMVRREVTDRAGLMPECYFLYYEELDWSMAIRRAGYDIWYEPAVEIFHKESRTTGSDSPLKTYYITRNRLLFAKRNLRGGTRILALCYLLMIVAGRDTLLHLAKGRSRHLRATCMGVRDFINSRYSNLKNPNQLL